MNLHTHTRTHRRPHRRALAILGLASALAACGGGGDGMPMAPSRIAALRPAAAVNDAATPTASTQTMPAMSPDAATLMQMGDAP